MLSGYFGRAALWAVALTLLAIGPTSAQSDLKVSNVFFQTDLRQALEDVSAQAGVNIITDPSVQGIVSITLDDVSIERALDLLLAGTEFRVQATEDYYLIYSPNVCPASALMEQIGVIE